MTSTHLMLIMAGSIVVSIAMQKKWPMFAAFALTMAVMLTSTRGGA